MNRTVAPLVISGRSKAVGVSGSANSHYAIWVNVNYKDGTALAGQAGAFATGTHDWQSVEFTITPTKPVGTVTVYTLFRYHSGTAYFDDISVRESVVGTPPAPDTTAPVVTITAPTTGTSYAATASPLTLSGTASDSVGVTSVRWRNALTGVSGAASGTASWSASVPLGAGSNAIVVTALDAAGNYSADMLTVAYTAPDTTVPTVAITNPTSATATASPLPLAGTASDNVGVTAVTYSNAANGATGTASGTTSWSASVALVEGSNALTVTARDAAGNTATDTLTVTYSVSTPPASAEVVQNGTMDQASGTLAASWGVYGTGYAWGTAYGRSATAGIVAWNGTTIGQAGASQVLSPNRSMAPLTVSGWSKATAVSGTADAHYSLYVDIIYTDGTALWGTSQPFATGDHDWQQVQFTVTPTKPVATLAVYTLFRNHSGTAYFDDVSIREGSTTTPPPGDTTAPAVSITGPTTGTTYTASAASVSLTGTASDNVGVASVTWSNALTGASGTAGGTTAWSASVALASGSNVLTVTARDAAGNTASDAITVTYASSTPGDTTAPTVAIAGPTTATSHTVTASPVSLTGTASDNVGVTAVTYSNAANGATGTASGTTSWSASVALVAGANAITVTARDAAGNTANDAITVTYETSTTPPPAFSGPVLQSGTATNFDGQGVYIAGVPAKGATQAYSTTGMTMNWDPATASVAGLTLGSNSAMVSGVPTGFYVRDMAKGAAAYPFLGGKSDPLGLSLSTQITANSQAIVIDGKVTDVTGGDRAVTLFFALPFPRTGAVWHDDARRTRAATSGDYRNTISIGSGANGQISRYPWAAVTGSVGGLALGMDMDSPAQFRLLYNAELQSLVLAYDFGLVKETAKFPSGAPFRLVIYPADANWGFRSAAERYQKAFPQFFTVRSKQQGIWAHWTDATKVTGIADFGFKYHNGFNGSPAADDAVGIQTYAPCEPSTYWMSMAGGAPSSWDIAYAELQRRAAAGESGAVATMNAGMADAGGRVQCQLQNTPWSSGAVWSLNTTPGIPGAVNGATYIWNSGIKASRYGTGSSWDGEFLDSVEGYVTAPMDFNRAHFAAAGVPLTFDTASKRPVVHKGLAIFEFLKYMANDVHGLGKQMFANAAPYYFPFLAAYLDVLGIERNWLWSGSYQPDDDGTLMLWRTMSGAKPYLLVQNSDFWAFNYNLVERYFNRSLFYGMFPSMFSADAYSNNYWDNPTLYNRDRPLFKSYIPVIKRVAEAGWQPVTYARATNANIERWGPGNDGASFFTVGNFGGGGVTSQVTLLAGAPAASSLRDIRTGETFAISNGVANVYIGADSTRALQLVP